jgi:rhodanese-related sulfurtransferase
MLPLIPQNFISGDLNFFFAFIIGLAFGFILEQAGFSSSRKLAGVFYGYDFVVLKVFFTAGVTAALGLFFFQYLGWVNIDMVFVNPLFLKSAIVGGVIMGFGFILGGFCPGTGFAAASIGKIDAMVYIGGIFLGVLLFGIFYDFFEPLYNADPLGRLFVFEAIGFSQKAFIIVLAVVAVVAFAITQKIQDNTNKFKELQYTQKLDISKPVLLLFVLLFVAFLLPSKRATYANEVPLYKMQEMVNDQEGLVSPIQLAYLMINNFDELQLIDVRTFEEHQWFNLPGSVNIPLENILEKSTVDFLKNGQGKKVLYSNGGVDAQKAWFALSRAGIKDIGFLQGGLNALTETFFGEESIQIEGLSDSDKTDEQKFIKKAREFFKEGVIMQQQTTRSDDFDPSRVQQNQAAGGC